ncbi:MAG: T9SS type A sorting domain-containing protein, partial [Phaeodactylibacter sp.]|nr:T9SS type A sorting domain-containing protein [Phaeodactylibacter sp.]
GSFGSTSSTFGPYPIIGGNKFITLTDASNPTCTLDVVAPAPSAGCGSVTSVSIQTSSGALGSSASAQNAAATLDDAFRAYEAQFCPGTYTPGVAAWADACNTGPSSTISGLSLSVINTMGVPYSTATLTEKLVAIDNSNIISLGTNRTGGCGSFGGSNTSSGSTLQGNAPLPNDATLGTNYYNAAASLSSSSASGASTKAALAINFSSAVNRVGLFLADTESRSDLQDGYPAVVAFFNNGTLLALEQISTGIANQSNCNGDNTTDVSGCGNNETVFIQYINEITPVTDIIVTIGQVSLDPSNVRNNLNSMAFFALTIGGACSFNFLPVELSAFTVRPLAATNELYWQTATETDNDHFVIERGTDGYRFEAIGEVEGAGTSLESIDYYFLDTDPLPGTSYYRLRQVDLDGQYALSDIRSVHRSTPGAAPQLFPTIATSQVQLQLGQTVDKSTPVILYNLLGQVLDTYYLLPGMQILELPVTLLPAGQYFLQVEGETTVLRFVKQGSL